MNKHYALLAAVCLLLFSTQVTGQIALTCPSDMSVTLPAGQNTVAINWTDPSATTSCTITDCAQAPTSLPNFMYMGEFGDSHIFCSSTNNFKWQEANAAANQAGGHLLVINSQAKNDFAQNAVGTSYAWIGYTDQNVEGSWEWVDGSPTTYTNWAPGEPNNYSPGGGQADYAVLRKSNGLWYDRKNGEKHEFIMEVPCPAVPGTASVAQTAGPANGSAFAQGTYTISYDATDDCANTSSCSFTVTVSPAATGPASVGDFVWEDTNGNGIQDAGEPGIAGVFVMLTDCNGNWMGQTFTDANGAYSFDNLDPGSYKLKFALVPGYVGYSPKQAGSDPTKDSDVNSGWTGFTDCFTLAAGENRTDIDAGFVPEAVPGGCDMPIVASVSNVQCNDNGTPNDPNDDTFTFTLTVISGADWGWTGGGVTTDMATAHTPQTFGPYPISGGQVSFTIMDNDNANCTYDVVVNPPAPCSTGPTVPILDPNSQPKFVNQLTVPPVIQPTSGNHYDVDIAPFVHDAGLVDPNTGQPLLTPMWGYNGMFPGPTFVVNSNQPITVTWNNMLLDDNGNPIPHFLPIDTTIHWAHPAGYPASGVPIVTHLHGGHTEWTSDGYPDAWYTPNNGPTGPQFVKRTYTYDNTQESTLLWYHDHTVGITRLNVYAGLAGAYIIRDNHENGMNLPKGDYEIPLIISDKSFYADGSLYYPSEPEAPGQPNPTVLPEMFGDIILVNGKAWPVLDVEPRKYRFRVLNASDSRFYHLTLSNGMPFTVIGTDGGFIDHPKPVTDLLMGPAERFDIILDFSDPALWNQTIVMNNDANKPYPDGAPVDPNNDGKVMAFRVSKALQGTDNSSVPMAFRTETGGMPTPPVPVRVRRVTLNEGTDAIGRIKPLLGTVEDGSLLWTDPITENPQVNEPEIWEVINTTPDAHPIHLHQIFFQVLDHQTFDLPLYQSTGAIVRTGTPVPELPYFKDTYIVPPGEIARFALNFDLPGLYVWHCHILSHEDFDMMRPLFVGDCNAPTNTPAPLSFMHCTTPGGATPGTIGDFAWVDQNANGIQDPGEPGLANVFAMLTDCSGNWLGQTFTDASGHYSFTNVPPGDYKVKLAPPAGYYVAPTHAGSDPTKDNDVNQGWTGFTDCFTITADAGTVDIDGGFVPYAGHVQTAVLNLHLEPNAFVAQLQWETNFADDADYYLVLRSTDGVNYQVIGQVESEGNAISTFTDNLPARGQNYYKVVAITLDGNNVLSNEVQGRFDGRDVRLFPNPADHVLTLDLLPFDGMAADIEFINSVGQVLRTVHLDQVSKSLVNLSLDKLPRGFYQVKVTGENGATVTKRLVIEHL